MNSTRTFLLRLTLLTILLPVVYSLKDDESKNGPSKTENTTDYLLPRDVIPTEYFITMTPFLTPDNFTFNGAVKILANVKESTSKVVLHEAVKKVHKVSVFKIDSDASSHNLELLKTTKEEKYQFLNIFMKTPLEAGTNISIEISYTGALNADISVGFFASSYKLKNETKWLAGTHFEPVEAREAFPCFDEPALRAVFHISIHVPKNYTALSNMPAKRTTKDGLVEFEATPPMSANIVDFVVSQFESVSKTANGHSYKFWSNPEVTHLLPYALSVMSNAIDFFESHFGIPYALPKLEGVAMPDFIANAMENWGLPLFKESFVLYDPAVTTISQKKIIRNAVTHELTHQWFGNLVMPKLWDYTWVSESFATYFEHHAHEKTLDSWNLEAQFVVNEMQPTFISEASSSANPSVRKVYSPLEILYIFDVTTYTKGACFVRMLEKILGPKIFYGALHRYLKANQYSTGTPELVYAAFEEEIKSNNYQLHMGIAKLYDSWTLQAGFPIVNVSFTGDVAKLTQKRFFLKPSENITNDSTWVIPISFATRSNPNFDDTRKVTWLTEKEQSITIKNSSSDWVVLNLQQTGYYRVNYDDKMWKSIIKVLKSKDRNSIHEVNRAALIDDLLNLGRVGALDYNMVLSATQYLTREESYVPWKAAFEGLAYLKKRFTDHPEIFDSYKNYVLSLLAPIYKKLGFYDKVNDELLDLHLRELLLKWLCDLDHDGCVEKSQEAFRKLKQNNGYKVPANQQVVVYCTAIRHGSTENWEFLWQKFEESINPIEKLNILSGLACSQNSTNLKKILLTAITPNHGIPKHDVSEVFGYVINAGTIGVQITLDFIGDHFNQLREYITDDDISIVALSSISQFLPTRKLVNKFNSFAQSNAEKMMDISDSLRSFVEDSAYEFNWYKTYSPKICNWLNENH